MKIAMIIPSLSQTGPGIVARDLADELVKLGHYCELFYFDNILGLKTKCKTTKINKPKDINPKDWDIIHSHGFRPDKFVAKYFARNTTNSYKIISTLHQPISIIELLKTYNLPKSIIGSLLWYKSLKKINHIVVLNSDTYNNLPSYLKEKSSVVFNGRNISIGGIESRDKKLLNNLHRNYTIIGTNSIITKRKGLEQIVKALPNLPNYAFIAIGDGNQREKLESLAKKLNVSNRCLFLGYRANSTDYLPYFDIFIMCTRSEGFPLALIEAASQGLPMVLSDIPILKAIVNDKMVSFYHLDDIDSLINAIRNLDRKKGEKIKDYYINHLTAQAMALRYLTIYNTLMQ